MRRFAVLALSVAAGCGSMEFPSHWRNREIIVDGNNAEWQDSLTYLLEDKQSSIGFLNDGRYLYVCLISVNRDLQRQAARPGLTVWFDREGGDDKKFGVHYPVALGRMGEEGQEGEDQASEFRNENPPEGANELEIVGPGENDRRRMTMGEAGGIEVRSRRTSNVLVYEMKVPLSDEGAHPFAIGTKPGSLIGVGIEAIRNLEGRRPPDEQMDAGERSGGGYGGRSGRGGRGERGGGGGTAGQAEQYKFWAKVRLASQETSTR